MFGQRSVSYPELKEENPIIEDLRKWRIKVLNDTQDILNCGFYENAKQQLVTLPTTWPATTLRQLNPTPLLPPQRKDSGPTLIIHEDCLEVALVAITKGYKPMVLNMASFQRPGGGYKTGAAAQEESLFRRTDLCRRLDCVETRDFYQHQKFNQGLLTKDALVLKHSEVLGYKLLDQWKFVDVFSCAAYKCTVNDVYIDQEGGSLLRKRPYDITRNKIDLIFRTAIQNGNDVLVLGAFGCGAYHNPPMDIARIFLEFVELYSRYFAYILFPILDDRNAYQNSKDGNLSAFRKVFQTESLDLEMLQEAMEQKEK